MTDPATEQSCDRAWLHLMGEGLSSEIVTETLRAVLTAAQQRTGES